MLLVRLGIDNSEEKEEEEQNNALLEPPDYTLLHILQHDLDLRKDKQDKPLNFPDIFEGRSSIAEVEMSEYQQAKLAYTLHSGNIDYLEASYTVLDDLDVTDEI